MYNTCTYIYICEVDIIGHLHSVKVAKSTAVADEALGNVRTVRAFAMETKENE